MVQGVVVVFRVVVGQWVAADDQLQPVAGLSDQWYRQAAVKVPGPDVVHLHTTQGEETGQDCTPGSEVSDDCFRFVCLLVPQVLMFVFLVYCPDRSYWTLFNDQSVVDSGTPQMMTGSFCGQQEQRSKTDVERKTTALK